MKRSKRMFTVMLALCVALSMAMASVTANAATKKPKKIYLKATSTTVDIKGKVKVSVYKTKPSKASKSVKWKSSNKKVATVSKSGYVTGKKKGTVKITATSKKNKRAKKTIKIKVTNLKAKYVKMSKTSAILFPNDKTTLKATVKGSAGFYNQGVTWKSSNTSVATVNSKGSVTAKKAGKATITATEKGGSKKATCAVTVSGIRVDKANKSVQVTATVNNADAKSMHYVVYKNGVAAKTSYFVTDATPAELNAALGKISAKAWNTNPNFKKDAKVAQAGDKTIDELAQSGIGNKNYTKLDITIKNGDQDIKMVKTLTGAEDNDNFSMIYSNVANNHNAGSGCLTCNTSCYAGVVTNEFKTWAEPFVPQNMPAKGTTVTITYTAQTDNYISAKTLKDNADNYVILDARKAAHFAEGHIAGAVSADMDGFVDKSITEAQSKANVKAVVDKYGKNKKYAVICYSGNRYAQAASAELRSLGVSNDNIFTLGGDKARKSSEGGMKAWKAAGYEVVAYNYTDVDGVKAAQSDDKTVILDARKADDYKDAHIDGAVSADMDGYVDGTISKADSDNNIKSVVEQKGADKKYIIICYSGNRYAKAATEVLVENGVKVSNISILKGGMGEWRSAGEALDHYNYTNADTTFSKMKDSSYVILDARKTDDASRGGYIQGHIPGAVSADVDGIVSGNNKDAAAANVTAAVDKYGKDKKYIVICYSGNRYAKVATGLLMNKGIKNANIQTLGGDDSQQSNAGGMKAWNAKYASYVVAKHTSSKGFNFANGITPENLKADVDGQKVFTVMDVRAKDDFDKGHISNAVSTPSGDEAAVMKAVNDNKNGLYVLVCYSGNAKADEARNTMVRNGVDESRIICLQDGMGTWK
ncbi:MAG: rhodanese-like domain-containing protein [Clostridia bacterium]|nr:rhodanese-like domain-containing protein [Clostridia bacterium]